MQLLCKLKTAVTVFIAHESHYVGAIGCVLFMNHILLSGAPQAWELAIAS